MSRSGGCKSFFSTLICDEFPLTTGGSPPLPRRFGRLGPLMLACKRSLDKERTRSKERRGGRGGGAVRASLIFGEPNLLPIWATNRQNAPTFFSLLTTTDQGPAESTNRIFMHFVASFLFFVRRNMQTLLPFLSEICAPKTTDNNCTPTARQTPDRCGFAQTGAWLVPDAATGAGRRPPLPFPTVFGCKGDRPPR